MNRRRLRCMDANQTVHEVEGEDNRDCGPSPQVSQAHSIRSTATSTQAGR